MSEPLSITDATCNLHARPQSGCFVCGQENPRGLGIRFEQQDGGEISANWCPGPEWEGFAGIVHGGVVSTVLDEAMSKAVAATRTEALTAELRVRFRHHVASGETYRIRGVDSQTEPAADRDRGLDDCSRWKRTRSRLGPISDPAEYVGASGSGNGWGVPERHGDRRYRLARGGGTSGGGHTPGHRLFTWRSLGRLVLVQPPIQLLPPRGAVLRRVYFRLGCSHLRRQVVLQRLDLLPRSDQRLHEAPVRRVGLVLVQHIGSCRSPPDCAPPAGGVAPGNRRWCDTIRIGPGTWPHRAHSRGRSLDGPTGLSASTGSGSPLRPLSPTARMVRLRRRRPGAFSVRTALRPSIHRPGHARDHPPVLRSPSRLS
jgi:hypothetical protein